MRRLGGGLAHNAGTPLTAGPGASLDYFLEAAATPDAGGHYNYDETWVGSTGPRARTPSRDEPSLGR